MKKELKLDDQAAVDVKYNPRQLYSAPWVPIVFAMAASAVIFHNNSFPVILLYFFLLFVGVGVILRLETLLGSLVGLIFISMWIAAKLLTGAWTLNELTYNLLELVAVGATFVASAIYRRQAKAFLKILADNQRRMKNLGLEDRAVGLIKSTFGLLRLEEEEERSTRYQRPFSLILIQVRPVPGIEWGTGDTAGLVRALADMIKAKTRDVDIPFLMSADRVALILPETEANGTRKVVNNIVSSMMNVRYVSSSGSTVFMWKYAQLRFGFATFLGKSNAKINMLEAAEKSLQRNMKTNPGDLYQNVFIEWETVGESPRPVEASTPEGKGPTAPAKVVVPLDTPALSSPNTNDKKNLVLRMIERLRSL
jgi:GGDEF domain-containing protein